MDTSTDFQFLSKAHAISFNNSFHEQCLSTNSSIIKLKSEFFMKSKSCLNCVFKKINQRSDVDQVIYFNGCRTFTKVGVVVEYAIDMQDFLEVANACEKWQWAGLGENKKVNLMEQWANQCTNINVIQQELLCLVKMTYIHIDSPDWWEWDKNIEILWNRYKQLGGECNQIADLPGYNVVEWLKSSG